MERKFPYLRIRVTDGEVRKLPIRKKNPGELLGPLAGASITVTREDRYEGVISAAIRTVHGGRPPRPEPVRGPVVARITFGGAQSRERQISGYARVEAAVEAAEFNELAALEPTGTGPAVPGVPYPRRRGRLGGLIAGVLSVPCELCGAPPGCGCGPVFAEMVRLAKSPPLVVHTGRMAGAIAAGAVSRHAVVAQFQGNPLPAAVAAVVAAARPRPASRLGARITPIPVQLRRADHCSTLSVPQTSVLRPKYECRARRAARHTAPRSPRLSETSGHNRAELERRLGHANDRYLRLYTNPADDIAAGYVEDL